MVLDQTPALWAINLHGNSTALCMGLKKAYMVVGGGDRPPDKSEYFKIIFLISHSKHMLWVRKRTVSMKTQNTCLN